MKTRRPDRASILAAAALGVLTLGVFAVAQNQGPLSSVQRFHAMVAASKEQDAYRAFSQESDPASAQQLYQLASMIMREDPRILVGEKESRGGRAWVDIAYEMGAGIVVLRYSLKKEGPLWLIDANETRALAPESFFSNSG